MNKPREKIDLFYRHYDLPVDFPLVVLGGGEWFSPPEPLKRMHFHNCLEIGILLEGCGHVYTENNVYKVEAPALLLVPPNMLHSTNAAEGSICRWNWMYTNLGRMCSELNPHLQTQVERFQQSASPQCLVLNGREETALYELIGMVIDEMSRKNSNHRAVVRSIMNAVAIMLTRITIAENRKHTPAIKLMTYINPALRYIETHYAEDLRIDDLAEKCNISAPHFRRLFRRVFEMSPLEYIENCRIEHACELLYDCNYSVTEIGAMTGFPSASSFDRQFFKRYGVSPSQWRKKFKNEENPEVTRYFERERGQQGQQH